jgi:hypothetical protein
MLCSQNKSSEIRKTVSVEDDRPDINVSSANSGMDVIDRHEVLRGSSVGIVPFPVPDRVNFLTALVPQLQLHLR